MSLWDLMQLAGPSQPLCPVTPHSSCFSPAPLPVLLWSLSVCVLCGSVGFLHLTLSLSIGCPVHFYLPCALIPWSPALICFPCSRLLQVTTSLLSVSIWMIIQNFHSACARLTLFPSIPVPLPICLFFFPLLSSLFLSLSFKLAGFKPSWEL